MIASWTVEKFDARRADVVHAAGHRIELRGSEVRVDGSTRPVSPSGIAMLRVLAEHPGNVVTREELLRALPGNAGSLHAVKAAVARLRGALGDKKMVATVVKRGYRLAIGAA